MNIKNLQRRTFIKKASKVGLLAFLPLPSFGEKKKENSAMEPAENAFLTLPYLQHLSAKYVTIMWITKNKSMHWIELFEDGKDKRTIVPAQHGLVQANAFISKLKISDLTPGTGYSYQVFSKEIVDFKPYDVTFGDTIMQGPYSFTTPQEKAEAVQFVVFNDLHDHPENIPELMGKFTNKGEYDFVVFNGDSFDWNDGQDRIIKDLLTPCGAVFSPNIPLLMVQGNHEIRGNFARESFQYFDFPEGQSYFAFTQGPVRFIVLDSGEDKQDNHPEYSGLVAYDPYRQEQARWLAEEVASEAYQQAAFKVVFIHIPLFYAGEGHGTMHCRKLFNPLLNEGKVDLVLSGHTHRFGTYDADPLTHHYPIVIGGGPGFVGRGGGVRTLIKVKATKNNLDVHMLIDDGTVVGTYSLKK